MYTAIPVLPSNNYQIKVTTHTLDFDWRGPLEPQETRHFYRAGIDTSIRGYTIYKHTLYNDMDGDGLNDLSEDILWTDPYQIDTDGDGKADGFDQNPLAGEAKELSLKAQLHKYIIEFELEEYMSNRMVAVEQYDNTPMEYKRPHGIVLSLSSGACDAFVQTSGYGIPVLTCTVKDTLEETLKASFQFFVAPDDAWGYDFTCKWDQHFEEWSQFQVIHEWVAK